MFPKSNLNSEQGKVMKSPTANELRRKAKMRLQESVTLDESLSVEDASKLVHELKVHQIELVMQNELLREAKDAEDRALYSYTELFDFAPIGYFVLNPSSKITRINLCGASMLEVKRSKLTGRFFSNYLTKDYQVTFSDFLTKAFETGDKQNCEILVQVGEHDLWLSLEAIIGGAVTDCLVAMVDITEYKHNLSILYESEEKFKLLYDKTPVMMNSVDANGIIETVNECWLETMGYQLDEVVGKKRLHFFTEESRDYSNNEVLPKFLKDGYVNNIKYDLVKKDGGVINVELSAISLIDNNGEMKASLATMVDVTVRNMAESQIKKSEIKLKQSEETLRKSNILFNQAEALGKLGHWEWDQIAGRYITCSEHYAKLREKTVEQVLQIVGDEVDQLSVCEGDRERYSQVINSAVESKQGWDIEYSHIDKSGRQVYMHEIGEPVFDVHGTIIKTIGTVQNITERKLAEEKLVRLAHYDPLTDLPNRTLLADRLDQSMMQCQRHNRSLAVAYMDLDGFKVVNDTYGHDMGDKLLIALAKRMKEALRGGDTLSRIGGDEFIAVMVDLENIEGSKLVLERLLKATAAPVIVGGTTLQVSMSIGVTFYPKDGADAAQLILHADEAMYAAKQSGKNRIHLFDAEQNNAVKDQS
jgi:diguanylate cyclase (GGDEF)-like protein/PAS domain S-box-containing protein